MLVIARGGYYRSVTLVEIWNIDRVLAKDIDSVWMFQFHESRYCVFEEQGHKLFRYDCLLCVLVSVVLLGCS